MGSFSRPLGKPKNETQQSLLIGVCSALAFASLPVAHETLCWSEAEETQASSPVHQSPTIMRPKALQSDFLLFDPCPVLRGGGGAADELAFALPALSGVSSATAAASPLKMCAKDRSTEAGGCQDLQEELDRAIKEERYQDAARIRHAIKAQGGLPSGSARAEPIDNESGNARDASDVRERLRQREIGRLRDVDPGGDNMATPW